jgi:outer membrane protein
MYASRLLSGRWAALKRVSELQVVLAASFLLQGFQSQAAETNQVIVSASSELTLNSFLGRVWSHNETLQIRAIESAISEERYRGEKGAFEPEFVANFDAVDRRRPNTEEQRAALSSSLFGAGSNVYNERNRTYSGALETLVPTGGKFRAGYTLQSLENNLNRVTFAGVGEWVTTVGISVTQPLLKGAGFTPALAGIRAAAIGSELSFQEYRRAVMELLAQAEATYWDLYQAQEQAAISRESLRIAQSLLTDNRKRLELGKAAEIEVQQAEAGVAQRQAILNESMQRLTQAQGRAGTYLSMGWDTNAPLKAVQAPVIATNSLAFIDLWMQAYELNPSYLTLLKQAELEGLRVKVARNQRLPQLDLKAGYGFSGIGAGPGPSWDAAATQDFPNWSIGLEMHIPLGGGIKSRHDLRAAELRRVATEKAINGLADTLANSIRSAITAVETYRENSLRYDQVIKVNQSVLSTQLARLEAGKIESRTVLEAEEDLFKGRITSLDNMIRYLRSQLDLEVTIGSLLKQRNLDLTQQELRDETGALVRSSRITPQRYDEFLTAMKAAYDKRRSEYHR